MPEGEHQVAADLGLSETVSGRPRPGRLRIVTPRRSSRSPVTSGGTPGSGDEGFEVPALHTPDRRGSRQGRGGLILRGARWAPHSRQSSSLQSEVEASQAHRRPDSGGVGLGMRSRVVRAGCLRAVGIERTGEGSSVGSDAWLKA